MNLYHIHPVTDNPLFEGLALESNSTVLKTWPIDWKHHITTWETIPLKGIWPIRQVVGNLRQFNDYPCVNLTFPAFSQRAVDLLRDVLEANGELLPVRHKLGIYYVFNCTCLANVIDLSKSKTNSGVPDIGSLILNEEKLSDLVIFKDRALPVYQLCTQSFVDRVASAGLQGFIFIPVWPLPPGMTYHSERYRLCKLAEQWKPNSLGTLDITGNTVVLRLCCRRKKVAKDEIAAAEGIISHLEKSRYDPNRAQPESYFGNVEGTDVVDFEIRVFISTPDCDRLLTRLMPSLQELSWPGEFYVVKRRGEFMDGQAVEEYVRVGKLVQ